ncbi:MAG TPA: exo-alpha-sialidase [Armatimonadota bacterium]|nr:exo-alpha-sialidase [Armatimonadota bacterium]
MSTSTELAANASLFPVWDPSEPFPSPQEMCDLDIVTHVAIERAQPNGYHYLHEATIAWHHDQFYLGWANHRTREDNNRDEIIRGRTSTDGLHWSEPWEWVPVPESGAESLNHPLLFSHGGKLLGFFVGWHEDYPTTEIYIFDESTGRWQYQHGSDIPWFLPFCTPQRMNDGNWVIGGEHYWFDAAVAISKGDDLTHWEMVDVPRDHSFKMLFPESAVVNQNDRLLSFSRPIQTQTAPVSESHDCGRTWTPLVLSNFPLSSSQPFAGRLSTGQNYLLTDSLEEGRALLSIAVTGPEGGLFRRIFKVRHQQWPARRLFGGYGDGSCVGFSTEWSYPSAIEHNGNLYITYTQGKEDCVLSIVPIEVLSV